MLTLRLTHTKNTICRGARDGASDIIHAAGVGVDLPSSAPKASNVLMSQHETARRGETTSRRRPVDPSAKVICPRARMRLFPATKTPPASGGGGSLLAKSKAGSFLASAEGLQPRRARKCHQAASTGKLATKRSSVLTAQLLSCHHLTPGIWWFWLDNMRYRSRRYCVRRSASFRR